MKHLLVIDLEATCCDDNLFARTEMEIIEIGAVMVQSANHQPVDEFQAFVRPLRHPALTHFCRDLTSITQSDVDCAQQFSVVLTDLLTWAADYSPYTFCSWGDYDRIQFQRDCDRHSIDYPFGDLHVDLKREFAPADTGHRNMGVLAALNSVGLSFVGSHHRGIDDARNISRLLPHIFPASDGSSQTRQEA